MSKPVWQKDYEQVHENPVGFQTRNSLQASPPFYQGKVERLVRFVKDNFLAGRIFWNVTGLNYAALEWCAEQNTAYHRGLGVRRMSIPAVVRMW